VESAWCQPVGEARGAGLFRLVNDGPGSAGTNVFVGAVDITTTAAGDITAGQTITLEASDDLSIEGDLNAPTITLHSTGDAAIFTDHVKVAHIIRKVLLRQLAILNYVNPF